MSSNSSSGGAGGGGNPRRVRLDDALSGWPTPERTALEWDESAEAVMSRLGSGPRTSASVSDEALWSAPLPVTQEEVQSSAPLAKDTARAEASMNTTSSRARDRASLKELARMAETPAPGSTQPAGRASRPSYPGNSPASGKFEAKEPTSSQPAASDRVERGEREENSGIINLAALTAEEKPVESAPVSSAATAAAAAAPVAVAKVAGTSDSKPSRLYVFGGLLAAAAVAAGVFVGMRRPASEMSAPVAAVPAPVQTVPAAATTSLPGVAVAPIAAADRGVDPSTLPPVDTSHGPASLPAAARPVAAASPAPAAATAAGPDPKLAAVIPAATPSATGASAPASDKSLESLMQQAAGVTSAPAAPAATGAPDDGSQAAPGSVPLRPSTGAVRGALGAVTPGARSCLDADDPISHAMVTFQSDGSVQNVTVSGGAAGKPAEACVRTALSKARIPPFASPTFSAPVTIRPN